MHKSTPQRRIEDIIAPHRPSVGATSSTVQSHQQQHQQQQVGRGFNSTFSTVASTSSRPGTTNTVVSILDHHHHGGGVGVAKRPHPSMPHFGGRNSNTTTRPNTSATTMSVATAAMSLVETTTTGGGGNNTVSAAVAKDPVAVLRACIESLLSRHKQYGCIPTLLLDTYRAVIQRHCVLAKEEYGVARHSLIENLTGEPQLLRDLREATAKAERTHKANDALQQHIESLKLQLRDRDLDVQKAEAAQTQAEADEIDARTIVRELQAQNHQGQADVMKLRSHVQKMQQVSQQTQHSDEQKLAERTADLRTELSRLYEQVRGQEEMTKSFERESLNAKNDLNELENKHAQLNRELELAQESIANKDEELGQMNDELRKQNAVNAVKDEEIRRLRIKAGEMLIQEKMIVDDPMWKDFKTKRLVERRESLIQPPTKTEKSLGDGDGVRPDLRYAAGPRVKARGVARYDLLVVILEAFHDLILTHGLTDHATGRRFSTFFNPEEEGSANNKSGGVNNNTLLIETQFTDSEKLREEMQVATTFAEDYSDWLDERCCRGGGAPKAKAELAYGVNRAIQAWKRIDPEVALFEAVLEGKLAPSAVRFAYAELQELFNALLERRGTATGKDVKRAKRKLKQEKKKKKKLENQGEGEEKTEGHDAEADKQSSSEDDDDDDDDEQEDDVNNPIVSTVDIHDAVSEFLHKPMYAADDDTLDKIKFRLSIDFNTPFVYIKSLFEVNEDGARTLFLEGVLQCVVEGLVKYARDVNAALEATAEAVLLGTSASLALDVSATTTASGGADADSALLLSTTCSSTQQQQTVSLKEFKNKWLAVDPSRLGDIDVIMDAVRMLAKGRGIMPKKDDFLPQQLVRDCVIPKILLIRVSAPSPEAVAICATSDEAQEGEEGGGLFGDLQQRANNESNSKAAAGKKHHHHPPGSPKAGGLHRRANSCIQDIRRHMNDVFLMSRFSCAKRATIQLPQSFQSFKPIKSVRSKSLFSFSGS